MPENTRLDSLFKFIEFAVPFEFTGLFEFAVLFKFAVLFEFAGQIVKEISLERSV